MPIHEFDIKTVLGRTVLSVNSADIPGSIARFRQGGIDEISINPVLGFRGTDWSFLRDCPEIERLSIVAPLTGKPDPRPILELRGLKSLTYSGGPLNLSLASFQHLGEFRGRWSPDLELDRCSSLAVLHLRGYRSKSKSLAEFPALGSLKHFGLVQGSIESVDGVSRLRGLKVLELHYLTKLKSLAGVGGMQLLERLWCGTCRKISNHDVVAGLSGLRSLRLNDCGEIRSLHFLSKLPALEEFRFVGTEVTDGDLSPLLRLKWVGFNRRKHYSHTPEQLDDLFRPKGGGAVVRPGDWDRSFEANN